MQKDLDYQHTREAKIEIHFKDQMERMRMSLIGEIYWVMKESKEVINELKGDEYAKIIHNYLLVLWCEDNKLEHLGDDKVRAQKKIHDNFLKKFDYYADEARKTDDPRKTFAEMFPKPEPTGEDKDDKKWGEMYEAYRDWVEQEFGDEEGGDGGNILDPS